MVVPGPVPEIVVPPGVFVNVHVPVFGNPLSITLPVDKAHVGCVIAPTTGADRDAGGALMVRLVDEEELHPAELATVNV